MRAADRMHREVITIDRAASLRRARRVMEDHCIRHLPVVDDRRLVGILTDRDIRQAAPSSLSHLTHREREEFMEYVRIDRVMTRRLIAVSQDATMQEAARLLLRYRIGCLPVMDDSRLVGILTTSDLVAALAAILDPEAGTDRAEVVEDAVNPEQGRC